MARNLPSLHSWFDLQTVLTPLDEIQRRRKTKHDGSVLLKGSMTGNDWTVTYTSKRARGLVGGAPWSRATAWRAVARGVTVDPGESDPCCAALRCGRHKSKGIVQQGVHLLPRLLNGGLWRHVGGWGRSVAWGRGSGTQEDIVNRGGAPLRWSWALVRVRLWNVYMKLNRDVITLMWDCTKVQTLNYSPRRPRCLPQDTFCKQHHCLQWWGGPCLLPSCLRSAVPSSSVLESVSLCHWKTKRKDLWFRFSSLLFKIAFHYLSAKPETSESQLFLHKTQKGHRLKTSALTLSWIPQRSTAFGHLGPGSYQSVSVLSDRCDPGPSHLWGHCSHHPWRGSHSGPSSWRAAVSCYGGAQFLTCVSVPPGSEDKIEQ